jgi:hypothetical protein
MDLLHAFKTSQGYHQKQKMDSGLDETETEQLDSPQRIRGRSETDKDFTFSPFIIPLSSNRKGLPIMFTF